MYKDYLMNQQPEMNLLNLFLQFNEEQKKIKFIEYTLKNIYQQTNSYIGYSEYSQGDRQ